MKNGLKLLKLKSKFENMPMSIHERSDENNESELKTMKSRLKSNYVLRTSSRRLPEVSPNRSNTLMQYQAGSE